MICTKSILSCEQPVSGALSCPSAVRVLAEYSHPFHAVTGFLFSGQSPKGIVDSQWLIVERMYYSARTGEVTVTGPCGSSAEFSLDVRAQPFKGSQRGIKTFNFADLLAQREALTLTLSMEMKTRPVNVLPPM